MRSTPSLQYVEYVRRVDDDAMWFARFYIEQAMPCDGSSSTARAMRLQCVLLVRCGCVSAADAQHVCGVPIVELMRSMQSPQSFEYVQRVGVSAMWSVR